MLGSLISAPGANVLLSKKRVWENFSPTPLTAQEKSLLAPEGTKEHPLSIYDLASGRHGFHTLDTYQGRNGEPMTLHKYLYAHANAANMIDPSGYFTQATGLQVEAVIRTIYEAEFPGNNTQFGTPNILGAILFSGLLKPDILDHDRGIWMEIKPFSFLSLIHI